MYGYHEYVPVYQKKANAEKALAKLKKQNSNISPIIIEGNKIAKTWWGISWNKNLESYADCSNRIGRGRAYLKNGMVLDLQIDKGTVKAIVYGSGSRPYDVTIVIDKLSDKIWSKISKQCSNKIGSIAELSEGKFPKELMDMFLQQGEGLFPTPKEIKFDCSCPDWAGMCKHIAAVLYGIGARFDEDALLFFKLREIRIEELLKKTVDEKINNMLKNSNKKSKRVIEDVDISSLFGI